jgi:hypothetical protein
MGLTSFIFITTGSFLVWMTKGFKGAFDDGMVSPDERNSMKGTQRYFLGLAIWITIFIVISMILSKPVETKKYKVRSNAQGAIERFLLCPTILQSSTCRTSGL